MSLATMENRAPGCLLTAEQIYREYAARTYSLARQLLGSDADADDVTQDVFVQVLRKLPTFRGEAAFPTWLYRITVNAALSYRRRRKHHILRLGEKLMEDGSCRAPVRRAPAEPEKLALEHETSRLIEEAIARLPEIYRDVYVLADVEALPNSKIAQMLGLSTAAIKSRLHRARLRMRKVLAPHLEQQAA
jgi:RNA polymerase sigma-70 factor (ECF subfamily)